MKLKYLTRMRVEAPPQLYNFLMCDSNLGYIPELNIWFPTNYIIGSWQYKAYFTMECRSVREFRRILKRASSYLPPGEKFELFLAHARIEGTTT